MPRHTCRVTGSRWVSACALAISYALIGRASLLFAVPPSTTSLAWPAAGLAVVCVCFGGWATVIPVAMGALALQLWIHGIAAGVRDPGVWGVAASAVLHAAAARFLIRRALGQREVLAQPGAVVGFLSLGGPVAALVSATCGVASLRIAGVLPDDAVAANWFAWWVGDTLGVVAFAPLFLVLLVPRAEQLGRKGPLIIVPLGAAYVTIFACFIFACFYFAVRLDASHLRDEIARRAVSHENIVRESFDAALEAPLAMRDMVEQRDATPLDAVHVIGTGFAARHPEVRAVEWVDLVPAAQRPRYERAPHDYPFPWITERDAAGRLVRAGARAVYYPVSAAEPLAGNRLALGYDLGSNAIRRAALEHAEATGEPAITERIDLVQGRGKTPGILVVVPVYGAADGARPGAASRRGKAIGFTVSVVDLTTLFDSHLHAEHEEGLGAQLVDIDAPPSRRELYASRDGAASPSDAVAHGTLIWNEPIAFAGRHYELRLFGTPAFIAAHRSLLPWTVLVLGLLFCSMLGTILLLHGTRAATLAREVRARTVGLRRALRRETRARRDRERIQHALEREHDAAEAARADAEAASRAKSRFLATLSHELRTPLNGVLGMSEHLMESPLLPEQRESVRTLATSADALSRLLGDILDFARIEAGRLDLEATPVWIHEVVHDVVRLCEPAAHDKCLDLSWEIHESVPPCVLGDRTRLQAILLNVVGNAVKFTPRGWVRIQISADAPEGDQVRLHFRVADSGIGIAPSAHESIFEPFSQVESSMARRYGGVGMGLSVARQLVEAMGGSIGVESAVGWGATFAWTVNVQPATDREMQFATCGWEPAARPAESPAPRGRGRLLVVDDTPLNVLVATRILQRLGYETREATSGAAALEILAEDDIDLVFMDCQMPEMDGFETTRSIRNPTSGVRNPQVPVVALTANALVGDRELCLAAGMNDYLSKPVKTEGIETVLAKWTASAAA